MLVKEMIEALEKLDGDCKLRVFISKRELGPCMSSEPNGNVILDPLAADLYKANDFLVRLDLYPNK